MSHELNVANTMTTNTSDAQNILQNNLNALKTYYPDVHSYIEATLTSYSVSFSGPGKQSITIAGNKKTITISAERRQATLSSIVKPETREPVYLIMGIGAGDELLELFDNTRSPRPELPNYKLPIYVVEPEPLVLIAAMCSHDMRPLLESKRVLLFVGEDASETLANYLKSHRQAIYPTHFVSLWYPDEHPATHGCVKIINDSTTKVSQKVDELQKSIRSHYDRIEDNEWCNIYQSGKRPLRVLGCTSRFTSFLQYCMRDLLAGFKEMGHETLMHIEESDISRATLLDLLTTVDEFKPDLIIYIDHLRGEYPYLPKNVPFVNWIQDMLPSIIRPNLPALGKYDFTFSFSKTWKNDLGRTAFYHSHPIYFLPVGINTNTYRPLENVKKSIDVLYVSHIVDPTLTLQPLRDMSVEFIPNEQESDLLENNVLSLEQLILCYLFMIKVLDNTLMDDLENYSPTSLASRRAFAKRTLDRAQIPQTDELVSYFSVAKRVNHDLHRAFKARPIAPLLSSGVNIRVYGNNWEKYPEFESVASGPAKNGDELNELSNMARICLNNSPGTSLHMRAVEIMGSKSFMLSRNIRNDLSPITDYFPEHEIALFNNEIDILEKVKFYLENDELREKTAAKNHRRALELFGYSTIASSIKQTIVERLCIP